MELVKLTISDKYYLELKVLLRSCVNKSEKRNIDVMFLYKEFGGVKIFRNDIKTLIKNSLRTEFNRK